jgi:hypothetical protein
VKSVGSTVITNAGPPKLKRSDASTGPNLSRGIRQAASSCVLTLAFRLLPSGEFSHSANLLAVTNAPPGTGF